MGTVDYEYSVAILKLKLITLTFKFYQKKMKMMLAQEVIKYNTFCSTQKKTDFVSSKHQKL